MLYGDYIEQDARWPQIRANGVKFAQQVTAAGGSVDIIDLPKIGIRGNSHLMDHNNREVADLIQRWLTDKGLYS